MSPAKPLSAPTSPLRPTPKPSPSNPDRPVTTSLRPCARPQKRDPLFSIACALFLIRNSVHPLYFVRPAHSLPKTPGGGVGVASQIPNHIPTITVTPIESYSFARIAPKPNGILLFHHDPGGWGTLDSTIQNPRKLPSAHITPIDTISSKEIFHSGLPRHPSRIKCRDAITRVHGAAANADRYR